LLLILTPLQTWVGDLHGLNTLEHQPTKVAAMEGNWETQSNVPLLLFALPDQENQTNRFEIGIPNLASIILTHSADGVVPGLNEVAPEEQPPVFWVFWSFRVMVGIGLLMIAVAVTGLVLRLKGSLWSSQWYWRVLQVMSITPFIAVLAGWFTTEIGRAPWLIYGVMTFEQGLTPSLQGWMALVTLIGYIVVYALVFTGGLYYLMRILRDGMEYQAHEADDEPGHRAKRPLSAVDVPLEEGA
jgi:cytochrome d ubiquinol oxidase subunit I